ncbi:MAG: hypothetical protein KAV87_52770 [Desulfobacteraceae bacterium]|nr:hypothetical protein [Desulfobacteraceae bacterium]
MVRKRKNQWESPFNESLQSRKEREDAEYLARNKARTDGVRKTLTEQRRKDDFNKIIREFNDLELRAQVRIGIHKERIQFLEKVLIDNRQWTGGKDNPLLLKPNLPVLQAKIREMKEYVAKRAKTGNAGVTAPTASSANEPVAKPRRLTPKQISAVYTRAEKKIELAYSGIIGRLATNVREGLPIERARERLMALGVSKYVADAFNEIVTKSGYQFSESEKKALKQMLLHPNRLGSLLDSLIKNA